MRSGEGSAKPPQSADEAARSGVYPLVEGVIVPDRALNRGLAIQAYSGSQACQGLDARAVRPDQVSHATMTHLLRGPIDVLIGRFEEV